MPSSHFARAAARRPRVAMPKVKQPRKLRVLANKANGGCVTAALQLYVHYYFHGTGSAEKNVELARQWLTRAGELGAADAQCILGVANEEAGELRVAYEWYEKKKNSIFKRRFPKITNFLIPPQNRRYNSFLFISDEI